ncbi:MULTISPECIES: hypothetical protein [Enterococcus]|uniref:hypothetical protein n=1 Tax=Enterococcus TaxID=1350 RepID=UPI000A3671A3|nr:hypothetical protein [Enterococcus sp. 4E1_DIV0656]OTO09279.1 hypothetical protein A5882_003612 [Enterococcus sp. 4E1_DIV0656]
MSETKEKIAVESGIVLRMDEGGLPMISLIGEVPLTHLTSYARLLSMTEQQAWENALAPKPLVEQP